jgi:hypothetical protein
VAANDRLMKFAGDLKALPYRDLRTFAITLAAKINVDQMRLTDALVAAAEEINPDQDDIEGPRSAKRQGLAEKI